MIAKPFIERFKQKNTKKTSSNSIDDNKFALLFRLINQIPSHEENVTHKLYDIIFHIFTPSRIIVSSIKNGGLKVEEALHSTIPHSTTTNNLSDNQKLINKPASSICELIKKNKTMLLISDIPQNYPNDPLLKSLNAESSCGFPIFNNQNEVITVVNLLFSESQPLSTHEQSLISTIIDRIGRERENRGITDLNPKKIAKEQKASDAEIANKTLESISYAISHDLRAPLRSIDSFSQILAEDYTSNLPEEALNYLNRIRRSTKRMGAMIDDLLWLSKVTRRKIEKQEVNLSKTASNIIEQIKEKNTKYNCEFSTDAHMIASADKSLIKIMLQHLLTNACKFSQHKEIIKISFTHKAENDEQIYRITDNGCGFDMNYYDQLFEPFKKLNDDRDYSGTGIGLATVKRIIQRHGGRVWAESEPEEGTSVFFTLGKNN